MLRAEYDSEKMAEIFGKLKKVADSGTFDSAVDIAGNKTRTALVGLTPKGWTGITRRSWAVTKPQEGQRLVFNSTNGDPSNPNKIMLWLEGGTGNAGTPTSHGGRIYPATKMFLFIPLTSTAAVGGWRKGMKFGVDFILAKSVRGITAKHIVRDYRPIAAQTLASEVKKLLQRTLT